LNEEAKRALLEWAKGPDVDAKTARRAKMILMAGDGMTDSAIADYFQIRPNTVGMWRRRYLEKGLVGLVEPEIPRAGYHTEGSQCSRFAIRLELRCFFSGPPQKSKKKLDNRLPVW
jgi:hypothetical protein